jgi:hypothetical protein
MNKVYLLIIFLLISCTSNNKIATKRQVQIKEKEIIKKENKTPIVYQAWLGTYWGMSSEQLKNLFPVEQKDYDLYCPEGFQYKDCSSYLLGKMLIGKEVYDIHFDFIENRLVNLKFDCNPHNRIEQDSYLEVVRCESEMNFLLKEKYGKNFIENIDTKSNYDSYGFETKVITTVRKWNTPEKEIKYRYYDCSGNCNGKFSGYKQLTINYTPNVDILKIESELYNLNKEMI